jgi:hypothetical protein
LRIFFSGNLQNLHVCLKFLSVENSQWIFILLTKPNNHISNTRHS